MIEINLLPENLRTKKQLAFDLDRIIYFSKWGLVFLLVIHIVLLLSCLFAKYKYSRLDNEWSRISSQNVDVISLKKEINALEDTINHINKLTQTHSRWSERLQSLSLLLPNGIWFNRIRATGDTLDITGSVISLAQDEVEILNKFLRNLKKDSSFSAFRNIDVVTIVRGNLSGVEIIDFSIRGLLEKK